MTDLQPELASFNAGSFNFSLHPLANRMQEYRFDWEKDYLLSTENNIHNNTFRSMGEYMKAFERVGTKPEFEVYDLGQINNIRYLIESGKAQAPVYLQFAWAFSAACRQQLRT